MVSFVNGIFLEFPKNSRKGNTTALLPDCRKEDNGFKRIRKYKGHDKKRSFYKFTVFGPLYTWSWMTICVFRLESRLEMPLIRP